MSSKKSKKTKSTVQDRSMIKRLVNNWQRERLWAMTYKHFLIFILLFLLVFVSSEIDLSIISKEGISDVNDVPVGFILEFVPSQVKGINLQGIGNLLEEVEIPIELKEPFQYLDIMQSRMLSWPETSISPYEAFLNLRYSYCYPQNNGTVLLHKQIGSYLVLPFALWFLVIIIDIVGWLLDYGGVASNFRSILIPLLGQRQEPLKTEVASVAQDSSSERSISQNLIKQTRGMNDGSISAESAIGQRKLGDLAEVISNVQIGKLDTRIDIESCPRELRSLGLAINSMLERIDEAYRLQAQFVTDASHELRTPLAVLQGYANLLIRWGKEDPITLQESLEAINSEAQYMQQLVEQLLFLARGDGNRLDTKMEIINVQELINEVFKEMQMIDDQHEWRLNATEQLFVRGDESYLKQALRALTDNAIKYTPLGEQIRLRLDKNESRVLMTVQDNGCGIAEDDLPNIFDRFFRADSSRDKKTGGTGLGLAIAKWIVEKHQGKIEVLSRVDLGTRFIIDLPEATLSDQEHE